ncbi:MAG: outer membrane lipoprotein carrier protein LolA [Zetaproteobacteria bacterium]|nr:outer membrane lipoprotein carrier protein LolA [Zetaproteobacteria bacterium]
MVVSLSKRTQLPVLALLTTISFSPPTTTKALGNPLASRPLQNNSKQADHLKRLGILQQQLSGIDHLTVHFRQRLFKSLRKTVHHSEGRATFKKPNQFRWVVTSPEHSEWLFDGETLTQYFPKQHSARRYPAGHGGGKEIAAIVDMVMNPESLLKRYHLTQLEESKLLAKATFTPHQSVDIEKIEIQVHTQANVVSSVHLYYKDQNRSEIEFYKHSTTHLPAHFLELPKDTKF